MIEDCINGTDGGTEAEILEILSRAYPQVAPGTLTSLQGDGATLTMSGTTQQESCDLAVWVPGADKPVPDVSGITQLATEKVDGGWIITGCATGEYTLSTP